MMQHTEELLVGRLQTKVRLLFRQASLPKLY